MGYEATESDRIRPNRTESDRIQPNPTESNRIRPNPTESDRSRPISTGPDPNASPDRSIRAGFFASVHIFSPDRGTCAGFFRSVDRSRPDHEPEISNWFCSPSEWAVGEDRRLEILKGRFRGRPLDCVVGCPKRPSRRTTKQTCERSRLSASPPHRSSYSRTELVVKGIAPVQAVVKGYLP